MSYKLNKPYTDAQRADFIVQYNHQGGLKIEETEEALFALLENEIMGVDEDGKSVPVINENYEEELVQAREEGFEQNFFNTSLGWIRRKVNMQDGTTKDFLSDLLLQIKLGVDLGQDIKIITYSTPDFSQEITDEYMISLQSYKSATAEFIQECLSQLVADFYGG